MVELSDVFELPSPDVSGSEVELGSVSVVIPVLAASVSPAEAEDDDELDPSKGIGSETTLDAKSPTHPALPKESSEPTKAVSDAARRGARVVRLWRNLFKTILSDESPHVEDSGSAEAREPGALSVVA